MQRKIQIMPTFIIIIFFICNCCSAEDWCKKAENDRLIDAIKNFDKCIASKCPESKCDCLISNGESMLNKRPELAKRYFEKAETSCSNDKKPQALYKKAKACDNSGDTSAVKTICSQLSRDYPQFLDDDKLCNGVPNNGVHTRPNIPIPILNGIRFDYIIRNESMVYGIENLTAVEAANLSTPIILTHSRFVYPYRGINASINQNSNQSSISMIENPTVIRVGSLSVPICQGQQNNTTMRRMIRIGRIAMQ